VTCISLRSARFPRRARQLATVGGCLVALAVVVSACSSSTPPNAAASGAVSTTTTAPAITSVTVIVNGKSVTVPTEANGIPIEQHISTGQNVVYTAKGFLPYWLFAASGQPIVFTNLSSKPVTIEVPPTENPAFTIQPGQSYSLTPEPSGIDQFQYRTANDRYYGKAQVGIFDQ
jgi:hypothetical protein